MPIKVPKKVKEGIDAVRDSGLTNMFDRPYVEKLCESMGYRKAAKWIQRNKTEYVTGIFEGFEVGEEE